MSPIVLTIAACIDVSCLSFQVVIFMPKTLNPFPYCVHCFYIHVHVCVNLNETDKPKTHDTFKHLTPEPTRLSFCENVDLVFLGEVVLW